MCKTAFRTAGHDEPSDYNFHIKIKCDYYLVLTRDVHTLKRASEATAASSQRYNIRTAGKKNLGRVAEHESGSSQMTFTLWRKMHQKQSESLSFN